MGTRPPNEAEERARSSIRTGAILGEITKVAILLGVLYWIYLEGPRALAYAGTVTLALLSVKWIVYNWPPWKNLDEFVEVDIE